MILSWILIGTSQCAIGNEASFAEAREFMRAAGIAELPIHAGDTETTARWRTGMVLRAGDTGTRERYPDEDSECTALLEPLGFEPQGMGGNLVGYCLGHDGGPQTILYAEECECLPVMGEPIQVFACEGNGESVRSTWASVAAFVAAHSGQAMVPGEVLSS